MITHFLYVHVSFRKMSAVKKGKGWTSITFTLKQEILCNGHYVKSLLFNNIESELHSNLFTFIVIDSS